MATSGRSFALQFSLWNCLVFTTLVSIACVALKYASPTWWLILSSASLLLFLAATVMAFVGKDGQRAFATGFTVCTVIYGALMAITGSNELLSLNPNKSWLPTATLLRSLYRVVENVMYVDRVTGKPLPDYKPPTGGMMPGGEGGGISGGFGEGGMGGMRGGFGGGTSGYYSASPPLEQFMRIGHLLWLDLLGFVGGWFAYLIVKRNKRDAAERMQSASP